MRTHAHTITLALILALALGWRMLLWSQPLHLPTNDEVEYVRVARDLAAGRGWVFYESWRWLRAPLYPLFLAGSLWLAGGDLHLAALPNVGLARELAPAAARWPALAAAGAAAALQTNATFASLYMSETLFTLLFGAALLAMAAWRRRPAPWRIALAGALLGLACLTRSAALIFLPIAGLWALWLAVGRLGRRPATLLPPLALALAAAVVIAPWTLHNCRAYGRCILIETGGSYNLWAFYEPRESLEQINAALEAIPNPADRSDEASRRGLARLREDPSIVARKIPAEWARLWAVKPIEDRFLLASNYSDPPPALFLSGLLLDDLLYLLILCAAPFGLALARRDALALLLGLWVAVFVGATLLTHAEGRYRHFLFVALIPLASVALGALRRHEGLRPGPALAATGPLALALLPLLLYYPWGWAGGGALRSVYRAAGDQLAAAGRYEAASRAYMSALEAAATPDGWIVLGDLQRRAGDAVGAAESYGRARDIRPPYVGASAALGYLLRAEGRPDEAREAFRGRFLSQQTLIDWSFQMRPPEPASSVDVGDGLDIGYVGGVYPAEERQGATVRWTAGRGRLRLAVPGPGPAILTMRVAAPWPGGGRVLLRVCAGGACQEITLGAELRVVRLILPPVGEAPIELRSPTIRAADDRDLGVIVDWARLDPAGRQTLP
jgi:tetratricopeptide (TPR) repeat protein